MGAIRSSLAQGSVWLMASRIMVNLLGLASTIALARLLLPEDFGIVATAWTMLSITAAIIDIPVGSALIQIRNPTRDHIDTAWTLGLLRGGVVTAILVAIAWPAARFFEEPALSGIILALGTSVLLSCVASPTRALVQRDLAFHLEFMIEVGAKFATVLVSIAIAWIYQSYWALVFGAIAGQAATVAIGYIMAPYRPRFSLKRFADLWSFSFWLTLSQAMATMNSRFDQILIAKVLGGSDLGIYTVGDNLAQMPTRETTTPLTKVLFPGFSALGDAPERLRNAYQRAQGLITTIILPVGVGVALVAEPAVKLGMGQNWIAVIFVIQALAAIYGLQTIGSLAQPLALSQGTTRTIFMRDLQLFFIRLPFILTGLFLGGLKGIVIARVMTATIWIFFNMAVVRSVIGLSMVEQLRANTRPMLAAAAMVIVVVLMRPLWESDSTTLGLVTDLILSAGVGSLTYAIALLTLWSIAGFEDGPEREAMRMIKARRVAQVKAG